MMLKRKALCLALALALLLALAAPAAAEDAARDYSREEQMAYALKALGLFQGYGPTEFGLDETPTRIQALVMMIRLLGEESEALAASRENPFEDVPADSWAAPYVTYAYERGLTKGQTPSWFGCDAPADVRTYLTFVLRALGYREGDAGDFRWDSPVGLAHEVGIAPDYVRFSDFRRADVVTVSYAALGAKLKGTGQTLAQALVERGVLQEWMPESYIDPAAAATGMLSSPYAENVRAFYELTRLPQGAELGNQTISYHGSVAQVGGAGYELYSFYKGGAADVAHRIAEGAAAVAGKARVFGIIVPNAMGAVLSYNAAAALCRTEKTETEAIDFAYEEMGPGVITVDAMRNLRLHNDEYIYFRTDHHWTALGSYYAYRAWAEAAGFEPVSLDQFDTREQYGHLGMFYSYCGAPQEMAAAADTIVAYVPHSSFTCSPANAMDFAATGYNTFIAGDRAITQLVNNDIADDSCCVLVKDSYGNPFAVWLTQHYHTVYVIDYRHYHNIAGFLTFSRFADELGADDFIVLLPMTLSQSDTTSALLRNYCR